MKKALVVFISILSIFSICLCSSLRDKQEKIESYINTTDSLSSKIELLYGNMNLHYAYNESFLRDFNVISMDGDTIQFSSLLNEKNILVYKFSLTNCHPIFPNQMLQAPDFHLLQFSTLLLLPML